jgi:hypothetical protein
VIAWLSCMALPPCCSWLAHFPFLNYQAYMWLCDANVNLFTLGMCFGVQISGIQLGGVILGVGSGKSGSWVGGAPRARPTKEIS